MADGRLPCRRRERERALWPAPPLLRAFRAVRASAVSVADRGARRSDGTRQSARGLRTPALAVRLPQSHVAIGAHRPSRDVRSSQRWRGCVRRRQRRWQRRRQRRRQQQPWWRRHQRRWRRHQPRQRRHPSRSARPRCTVRPLFLPHCHRAAWRGISMGLLPLSSAAPASRRTISRAARDAAGAAGRAWLCEASCGAGQPRVQ